MFSDDLGWNDALLAGGELMFGRVEGEREDDKGNIVDGFALADFIKVPMSECDMSLKIIDFFSYLLHHY